MPRALRTEPVDFDQPTDMAKATPKEKILVRKTHQTLKRVTNDFESRWHFNTSVALIMELVNELHRAGAARSGYFAPDSEARAGGADPDAFADDAAHRRGTVGDARAIPSGLVAARSGRAIARI